MRFTKIRIGDTPTVVKYYLSDNGEVKTVKISKIVGLNYKREGKFSGRRSISMDVYTQEQIAKIIASEVVG